MLAYLDNKTKQITSYTSWEEFAKLIPVDYQFGHTTETFNRILPQTYPAYKRFNLLEYPTGFMMSEKSHLHFVELIRCMFLINNTVMADMVDAPGMFPTVNFTRDCINNDNRNYIAEAEEFNNSEQVNERLVAFVNFRVMEPNSDGHITFSGAYAIFEKPYSFLLDTVQRVYTIDTLLNDIENAS